MEKASEREKLNEGIDKFSGANKGGYHCRKARDRENTQTGLKARLFRQDLDNTVKYCKGIAGKDSSSEHDETKRKVGGVRGTGQPATWFDDQEVARTEAVSCYTNRLVVKLDMFSL